VDGGIDRDFGKPVPQYKIRTRPFYAVWATPLVHDTRAGLRINAQGQVLDMQGQVIPGLYCGGESAGGCNTEHTPRLYTHPVRLPAPEPLTPPDNPRILRGYVQKLHMAFQHQSPGQTRLSMPCTALYMDERGCLHPGALASITELAGTAAAWSLVPRHPGARGATVGMHFSYTSTTTDSVVADAHVQQRSEELFFSTVHVTDATTGQLVTLGEVTYRLLEPRPG
jgi:acyl-coenzyme A thioesterase PaaI-like protein